jgi:integrase
VFCTKKGEPIGSVQTSFESACRRANIANFRFHDLRHTCAAWLIQAGVSITQVRDVLGHSTVAMTEKYAHLAPENARAAVAVLEGNLSRLRHVQRKTEKAVA